MPSLRSLAGRLLRLLDRVAGTQVYPGLRAGLRVARAVGPDRQSPLWILGAGALRGPRKLRRRLRIRVIGPAGPRRFVVPDVAAMYVLEEIFCDSEYAVALPSPPRRIVDL